jgi:hypothetical protein
MLLLERLSPLERASFLLHDVFGLDFAEVAPALGRGEVACRQLAARARAHIEAGRPRFSASHEEGHRLACAFQAAIASGDTRTLAQILAQDAVLYIRTEAANARPLSIRSAGPIAFSASLPELPARTRRLPRLRPAPPWLTGG